MLQQLLIIASAHLLAVISPGPDLAIVTSIASKHGKKAGIYSALGIASGIAVHITYCMAGVALLLQTNELLFNAIRVVGSLYIIWLACQLISSGIKARKASIEQKNAPAPNFRSSYLKGLLTNVSNPKATLFFLALFTQVIEPSTTLAFKIIASVEMVVATFTWFALISLVIGTRKVRSIYLTKAWIADLIFGIILGVLGVTVLVGVIS